MCRYYLVRLGLNIFITHKKQHMDIHDMQSIDRIRTEALKTLIKFFSFLSFFLSFVCIFRLYIGAPPYGVEG